MTPSCRQSANHNREKQQLQLSVSPRGCIKSWMHVNRLKLNDNRTECMLFGPSSRCEQSDLHGLQIGRCFIPLSTEVRDVIMDSELSMSKHVTYIAKVRSDQLRNIGSIRKFQSQVSAVTRALSLVISRIDYCNELLTNTPKSPTLTNNFQRIQNTAARIVSCSRKYDHITIVPSTGFRYKKG
ncbi:uncharacterized protein [Haliotis asinina]|uniref:uncharacterized protein n=1 Tax=Haliotis asinina TaxID=109174 RepID=UPI003532806E